MARAYKFAYTLEDIFAFYKADCSGELVDIKVADEYATSTLGLPHAAGIEMQWICNEIVLMRHEVVMRKLGY